MPPNTQRVEGPGGPQGRQRAAAQQQRPGTEDLEEGGGQMQGPDEYEDVVFVDEHSGQFDDGVEADEDGWDGSDGGDSGDGKAGERCIWTTEVYRTVTRWSPYNFLLTFALIGSYGLFTYYAITHFVGYLGIFYCFVLEPINMLSNIVTVVTQWTRQEITTQTHRPTVRSKYKANGKEKKPRLQPTMPRHVIVAVCCYKEPVPIVSLTMVHAAEALLELAAKVPEMTAELVMCDDEVAFGAAPAAVKSELTAQLDARLSHQTGGKMRASLSQRRKFIGDVNGKSTNINSMLLNRGKGEALTGPGIQDTGVDNGDWLCVLDADMKCEKNYFCKALGVAVGQQAVPGSNPCHYVLCPQAFDNVDENSDVLNRANHVFWRIQLPSLFSWGYIACTGTNLLASLHALCHAAAGFKAESQVANCLARVREVLRQGCCGAPRGAPFVVDPGAPKKYRRPLEQAEKALADADKAFNKETGWWRKMSTARKLQVLGEARGKIRAIHAAMAKPTSEGDLHSKVYNLIGAMGYQLLLPNFLPADSITEDYSAGMLLSRWGAQAVYLGEDLVKGIEETTFWKLVKQRMRWCKGHWQVFESRQNPLLLPGMALRQRFLFAYTGVISYIATMIAIPANSVLPLLALAGGVFPFLVDNQFGWGVLPYYVCSLLIQLYVPPKAFGGGVTGILKGWRAQQLMTFCSYTLVYAFWKACLLTTWYRITGAGMSFHSGGKGAGGSQNKNMIPAASACKGPVVKVTAENPDARQKQHYAALPAPYQQQQGALPPNAQVIMTLPYPPMAPLPPPSMPPPLPLPPHMRGEAGEEGTGGDSHNSAAPPLGQGSTQGSSRRRTRARLGADTYVQEDEDGTVEPPAHSNNPVYHPALTPAPAPAPAPAVGNSRGAYSGPPLPPAFPIAPPPAFPPAGGDVGYDPRYPAALAGGASNGGGYTAGNGGRGYSGPGNYGNNGGSYGGGGYSDNGSAADMPHVFGTAPHMHNQLAVVPPSYITTPGTSQGGFPQPPPSGPPSPPLTTAAITLLPPPGAMVVTTTAGEMGLAHNYYQQKVVKVVAEDAAPKDKGAPDTRVITCRCPVAHGPCDPCLKQAKSTWTETLTADNYIMKWKPWRTCFSGTVPGAAGAPPKKRTFSDRVRDFKNYFKGEQLLSTTDVVFTLITLLLGVAAIITLGVMGNGGKALQDPYIALPLVWGIVGAIPLTCWALILVLGEHKWVGWMVQLAIAFSLLLRIVVAPYITILSAIDQVSPSDIQSQLWSNTTGWTGMTYPAGLSPRYNTPLLLTGRLAATAGSPNPLPTSVFAPTDLALPPNATAALLGAGMLDTSYTINAGTLGRTAAFLALALEGGDKGVEGPGLENKERAAAIRRLSDLGRAMLTLAVSPNAFIAQVGDPRKYADPTYFSGGPPFDPVASGMLWSRPSDDPYLNGTLTTDMWIMAGSNVAADTAGELAAGMAAAARVLKANYTTLAADLSLRARAVANLGLSALPDPATGVNPTVYCDLLPCAVNLTRVVTQSATNFTLVSTNRWDYRGHAQVLELLNGLKGANKSAGVLPNVMNFTQQCINAGACFSEQRTIVQPVTLRPRSTPYDKLAWAYTQLYANEGGLEDLGQADRLLRIHKTAVFLSPPDNQGDDLSHWVDVVLAARAPDPTEYKKALAEYFNNWLRPSDIQKPPNAIRDDPAPFIPEIDDSKVNLTFPNFTGTEANINGYQPAVVKLYIPICQPTVLQEFPDLCDDGIDNDCDGLVDEDDPGCQRSLSPITLTPTLSIPHYAGSQVLPSALMYMATATYAANVLDTNKPNRKVLICDAWRILGFITGSPSSPMLRRSFGGQRPLSYVLGQGAKSPKQVLHRASSCAPYNDTLPRAQQACSWTGGFYAPQPNPGLTSLEGLVVQGPDHREVYEQRRDWPGAVVRSDLNALLSTTVTNLVAGDVGPRLCFMNNGLWQKRVGTFGEIDGDKL